MSTPLMYALNTRAWKSAQPAASSTLLGCQSIDVTVDRRGRLMCLATHQSLSSSKEHTEMMRALLATANLSSRGLQRTAVAPRCSRSSTRVGFHVAPDNVHTYAFRSCEQLTMRFVFGAQSRPVTTLSWPVRECSSTQPCGVDAKMQISLELGETATLLRSALNACAVSGL